MIEKMKFISITGPKEDFDRMVSEYLSKYEIQLENALSELKTVKSLRPFSEPNPYKEMLQLADNMVKLIAFPSDERDDHMDLARANEVVASLDKELKEIAKKTKALEDSRTALKTSLGNIANFRELDYNVETILKFRFIKFRFGRMPHEHYDRFIRYVYDELDTVFYKCHEDDEYVWGVYFVPHTKEQKVDAIYSSMHFERFHLPDEYEGTPEQAYHDIEYKLRAVEKQLEDKKNEAAAIIAGRQSELLTAYELLSTFSENYNIRKMAALTNEGSNVFYILCGWMPKPDADAFLAESANDSDIYCVVEDGHVGDSTISSPPTKLKNPRIFKPFEMYIKMYGLPAYNELDPTIFVALTYSFIFGAMFGDVGQGLLLAIGGFILYKVKNMQLAAIISCAGVFSTIFGFLFGSVFGFEDVIDAVWLRPVNAMSTVPFIGKLNTVFVIAVAFGMGIILLSMVLHIINAIKSGDKGSLCFDTNGIAGLVFYGALTACIVLFMTGNTLPAGIVLVVMFVIPLLLIAAKEPLTNLLEKKRKAIEGGKVMFFVQAFFELFEVLLSYFSNTISFVRVGAFAVSHAAMMEVVLMLAGAESGSPNWIVVVLGNLFVCGLEGLIVGIQVLRLEYYEMFSRFYKGTGKEFTPLKTASRAR